MVDARNGQFQGIGAAGGSTVRQLKRNKRQKLLYTFPTPGVLALRSLPLESLLPPQVAPFLIAHASPASRASHPPLHSHPCPNPCSSPPICIHRPLHSPLRRPMHAAEDFILAVYLSLRVCPCPCPYSCRRCPFEGSPALLLRRRRPFASPSSATPSARRL